MFWWWFVHNFFSQCFVQQLKSDWCWNHADIMPISCWFRFQFEFHNAQQLQSDWCWNHAEFMLNSCWFHADFVLNLNFTMLCAVIEIRLVLNSCRIHVAFMLNFKMLCAIRCVTMVLNSCYSHAEFMLSSRKTMKSINLPRKWNFKHSAGL